MILALDIGGTKLAAAAISADGDVVEERRVPTPRTSDPEVLWTAVTGLIEPLTGPFDGLGAGCGGPMTPGGERVSPLNIPAWRDFPLRSRLAEWSGVPVQVDNDAKALTLGEWWTGALRGRRSAMAMVVSTGVGGGLIVDGQLLDGVGGNAGHLGHIVVEPNGRPCPCGARGCLEAEIAGPRIEEQAGHGPPFPAGLLARAGTLLGRALAGVGALCDIEAVAVGGGVTEGAGEALLGPAREELARSFRIFGRTLDVVPVASGPLVGAAAVFLYRTGRLT